MINLSSFIAFHARRTPGRCALKYRGEDISYTDSDRDSLPRNPSGKVLKRVLRAELEAHA